jgi:hypothetical protein
VRRFVSCGGRLRCGFSLPLICVVANLRRIRADLFLAGSPVDAPLPTTSAIRYTDSAVPDSAVPDRADGPILHRRAPRPSTPVSDPDE